MGRGITLHSMAAKTQSISGTFFGNPHKGNLYTTQNSVYVYHNYTFGGPEIPDPPWLPLLFIALASKLPHKVS